YRGRDPDQRQQYRNGSRDRGARRIERGHEQPDRQQGDDHPTPEGTRTKQPGAEAWRLRGRIYALGHDHSPRTRTMPGNFCPLGRFFPVAHSGGRREASATNLSQSPPVRPSSAAAAKIHSGFKRVMKLMTAVTAMTSTAI